MKAFFYILGALLLLAVIAFFVTPSFLDSKTNLSVSKDINAPTDIVYTDLNNLRKQVSYNSFLKQDSALTPLYYVPYTGKGANFKWKSENPNLGNGDIIILSSKNNTIETLVTLNDFDTSYKDKIFCKPLSDTKTQLTISRTGEEVPYLERYLVFLNKSKYTAELEATLSNIESDYLETDYSDEINNNKEGKLAKEYFEGGKFIVIEHELDIDNKAINIAKKQSIKTLNNYLFNTLKIDSSKVSNPITYIEKWDTINAISKISFGYSVLSDLENKPESVTIKAIPATNIVSYVIKGNYSAIDSLQNTLHLYSQKLGSASTQFFWLEELESNATQDTLLIKAYESIE